MQATIRSFVATFLIAAWCRLRGIPLFNRDGTLWCGLAAGALFAIEFILIYQGLLYTTATRAVLFIYLAPFFVVIGARFVLPADRFGAAQWLGLGMSFVGMLIAFGLPTPALDPRQHIGDTMMVGGALFWAATTLTIKASALTRASAEKVMLYQLVVSGPLMALAAFVVGERMNDQHSVGVGDWIYDLPNCVGGQRNVRHLVRTDCTLFGDQAFGLYISHAVVRRCRRTPRIERAIDARVCRGGRAGRCWPHTGEPFALMLGSKHL